MTTTRIAQPAPPSTPGTNRDAARSLRALALWRRRRHDVERIGEDTYLVPSCSVEGAFYRVDYRDETCSCPDSAIRRELCKHVLVVGIHRTKRRAKTAACAGCGERHLRRELIEVGPERAEMSVEALEGQRYCRPCALRRGVL